MTPTPLTLHQPLVLPLQMRGTAARRLELLEVAPVEMLEVSEILSELLGGLLLPRQVARSAINFGTEQASLSQALLDVLPEVIALDGEGRAFS